MEEITRTWASSKEERKGGAAFADGFLAAQQRLQRHGRSLDLGVNVSSVFLPRFSATTCR